MLYDLLPLGRVRGDRRHHRVPFSKRQVAQNKIDRTREGKERVRTDPCLDPEAPGSSFLSIDINQQDRDREKEYCGLLTEGSEQKHGSCASTDDPALPLQGENKEIKRQKNKKAGQDV